MKISLAAIAGAAFLAACSSTPSGSTTTASVTSASAGTTGSASGTTGKVSSGTTGSDSAGTSGTGSTGATAGSTGTASASGTTGVSNQGCQAASSGLVQDGGGFESATCATNADCGCPLACQTDPVQGGLVCVFPCGTSADCPDATTTCKAGACVKNLCAADGGTFDGTCNATGQGDGICADSFDSNFQTIGVCQPSGSAALGMPCSPNAPRDAGATAFCAPGATCSSLADGGNACQSACDPTASTSQCGTGNICAGLAPGFDPQSGTCSAVGPGGCAQALSPTQTLGIACATSGACGCNQNCVNDPVQGQQQCSAPCTTTADCADPTTSCQSGFCVGNLCAGDAGPFYGPCNAADAGDGICEELVIGATQASVGVCLQLGSAATGATCDPSATRQTPTTLCSSGLVCVPPPQNDGGTLGQCTPGCDTNLTTQCGSGKVCAPNNASPALRAGICLAGGAGGCAVGLLAFNGQSTELSSCPNNGWCGCPQNCVMDPGQGTSVCEQPCASTGADCNNAVTSCQNGFCNLDYCQVDLLGHTQPGSFETPCNAATDGGDGTCQAESNNANVLFGLCQQNGSAALGANCDSTVRDGGVGLCGPGAQCFSSQATQSNACSALCDPVAFDGGSCGAGNGCFSILPGVAPTYGGCFTCTPSAQSCGTGTECCSGLCVGADAGFGAGACQ